MNSPGNSTPRRFAAVRNTLRPVRQILARILCPRPPFSEYSFSQEGEDMLLRGIFEGQTTGFYVDVGAHHPQRFSNTHYFYLAGWRGINIDAMPGSMQSFETERPDDINVEAAISDSCDPLVYYVFEEPALNTFSATLADRHIAHHGRRLLSTVEIKCRTLGDVLDEYLPPNQPIDFLSIDAEGLDAAVIRSNNWSKYRPSIILAEDLADGTLEESLKFPLVSLLGALGYRLCCKTTRTLFFQDAT
jgi:FkbM family methyltransferase